MKKTRPQPQSGGKLVSRNRGCGYTFPIREGKGVGKVMDWSEEIRRRREERHLSQEELAEAVGVSRQAVSKWESGAAQPTGANRRALLQALDLREEEEAPPLRRAWRERAGWIAAGVLLLALAGALLLPRAASEAPAGPRLQSVRFYDEAMQEVLPEANWYDADRAVCLLVQWEGGSRRPCSWSSPRPDRRPQGRRRSWPQRSPWTGNTPRCCPRRPCGRAARGICRSCWTLARKGSSAARMYTTSRPSTRQGMHKTTSVLEYLGFIMQLTGKNLTI